ncbi:MAG: Hpt domain-containing protein [Desulfobacterium sp.]|nr:Hpt domain-containing protein [Desulfobacterium sp.]
MGEGKKKQPGSLSIDKDRTRPEAFDGLVALPPAPLLPSVLPGIDINEGLMRVDNNPRRFVSLLRKFAINQADTVSAIETALVSGKKQHALDHIHALKGVSGNLGARGLRQAAKAVETAIKQDKKKWMNAVKTLSSAMERLIATIASLPPAQAAGPSVAPAKAPQPEEIAALVHELKRLLAESDTQSGEILQQLQTIVIEPVLTRRLQALDKSLENYDFEQTLELLNGIPGV